MSDLKTEGVSLRVGFFSLTIEATRKKWARENESNPLKPGAKILHIRRNSNEAVTNE